MYPYLLFDADGTLFDFKTAEEAALKALCDESGISCSSQIKTLYSAINQQLWHTFEQGGIAIDALKIERFRQFYAYLGLDADPMDASQRYLDYLAQSDHIYPETVPVLEELHRRGYRISLITNGVARVQRGRLAATHTGHFFEQVFISEELGEQKPDAAYFSLVLDRLEIPVHQTDQILVIGDSLSSDIQGGINAGLATCWYNPERKPAQPDIKPIYEINHLKELLTLLPPIF